MALKTFNLDEGTYKKYSSHCKKEGISMSKQIERFIAHEVAKLDTPRVNNVSTPVSRPILPKKSSVIDEHSMRKFC